MNKAYIDMNQGEGNQNMIEFNKELAREKTTEDKKEGSRVPEDIQNWNKHMKQHDFDPFEKVVLVKGIDN